MFYSRIEHLIEEHFTLLVALVGILYILTFVEDFVMRELERATQVKQITDPNYDLNPKLLWPFKDRRPLAWGWRGVEREGARCENLIPIDRLELVPFHVNGEDWVDGEEMLRRANDAGAFPGCQGWSQHHAEDILERANELSEAFREFSLVFPDTILLNERGERHVPYITWRKGKRRLCWNRLDIGIYCNRRFIRLYRSSL